jgi:hypothetical protein
VQEILKNGNDPAIRHSEFVISRSRSFVIDAPLTASNNHHWNGLTLFLNAEPKPLVSSRLSGRQ